MTSLVTKNRDPSEPDRYLHVSACGYTKEGTGFYTHLYVDLYDANFVETLLMTFPGTEDDVPALQAEIALSHCSLPPAGVLRVPNPY